MVRQVHAILDPYSIESKFIFSNNTFCNVVKTVCEDYSPKCFAEHHERRHVRNDSSLQDSSTSVGSYE